MEIFRADSKPVPVFLIPKLGNYVLMLYHNVYSFVCCLTTEQASSALIKVFWEFEVTNTTIRAIVIVTM